MTGQDSGCRTHRLPFSIITTRLMNFAQIDRVNLEACANLEQWVAELEKQIEGILFQRLTLIIQLWCAEFDRSDDSDTRRDLLGTLRVRGGGINK